MIGLWPFGARKAGHTQDLKSAAPALVLVFSMMLTAPASAKTIGVEVKGGSVVRDNGLITVWANSPQATLTLSNPGASFYQAKIQWLNVPTGAFLTTPQGVSDGASRDGTLSTSISVPGGSQGVWKLDPNLKGSFRFIVTGGGLGGLSKADNPNFAIHLGNSGHTAAQLAEIIKSNRFPTYALRGTRDETKAYQAKLGKTPSAFTVGSTGFIFLDNASGRLSGTQHQWLAERFAQFREANVSRSFVFLHLPMVDPRQGRKVSMRDRDEVLKLLRLFKDNHVQMVFAGNLPLVNQSTWRGVPQVIVGGAYAMSVEVTPDGVSLNRL
jgi:hypothetical protein